MNERVKYPIVITVICVLAAVALAFTYAKTKDRIRASKNAELDQGLAAVLPAGKASISSQPLEGDRKLYIALDSSGKPLGYAAIGKAQGYSSTIETLVGVDLDLRIIGIRILSQQETPGLGERTKEVPPTETLWTAIAGAFTKTTEPAETTQPGAAAEEVPPFQQQFAGKTKDRVLLVKHKTSDQDIEQITGATITSYAVVSSVKDAVAIIENALKAKAESASSSGKE